MSELLATMVVDAVAERLKLLRALVQAVSEQAGADRQQALDIVLAVDEACQNVVRHAYPEKQTRRPLRLEVRRAPGALEFKLSDDGRTFDPATVAARPPDELRPGGRGLYLIRATMDRVDHRPGPDGRGNVLTLTRRLDRR